MNRKKGETEAMQILKAKGILFDESYCDTGYEKSKPDLRYSDGGFLEVTHTVHNDAIADPRKLNNYARKDPEEKRKAEEEVSKALDRVRNYPQAYSLGNGDTFEKDQKIIDNHYGKYDPKSGRRSEFKCDLPIVEGSSDNIIETIKKKSLTHPNADTDLFIFVLEGEFDSMMYLIESLSYNGNSHFFMKTIMDSPFQTIYICKWNYEWQEYVLKNPTLIKFWKDEKLLKYQIQGEYKYE